VSWWVWSAVAVGSCTVIAAATWIVERAQHRAQARRELRAAEWQRLLARWQQPPKPPDPPPHPETEPMRLPGRHHYPDNLPGDRQ
jgi:hypothetical protein